MPKHTDGHVHESILQNFFTERMHTCKGVVRSQTFVGFYYLLDRRRGGVTRPNTTPRLCRRKHGTSRWPEVSSVHPDCLWLQWRQVRNLRRCPYWYNTGSLDRDPNHLWWVEKKKEDRDLSRRRGHGRSRKRLDGMRTRSTPRKKFSDK